MFSLIYSLWFFSAHPQKILKVKHFQKRPQDNQLFHKKCLGSECKSLLNARQMTKYVYAFVTNDIAAQIGTFYNILNKFKRLTLAMTLLAKTSIAK